MSKNSYDKQKNSFCCVPAQCCCQPYMEPMSMSVQSCTNGIMPINQCCRGGSKCSFSCLIILILILLQFSNSGSFFGGKGHNCCEGGNFLVDKGIIFIIALYYLSCVCPCD